MKNLKQIAFGISICAMVIGFSAFTNAKNAKKAPGDVYAETSNGEYTLITNYDAGNCKNTSSNVCAYEVTSSGGAHVTSSFTASQAGTFVTRGWIVAEDSDKGVYTP
jgi:hypothetical protein